MKIVLKRIGAYLIDIILVSVVATFISSNAHINSDYKKYKETYAIYNTKYEEYSDYHTKLENYYEDKELNKKEYNKLLKFDKKYTEDLLNYYEDEQIDEEEFKIIIENLNAEYSNIEINYSYKLLKYSIIPTIVSLMCTLLYFVVIQFYCNGQTLGKKIMNLSVVSNNSKKLNISNFLLRSLIANEVLINIISTICLIVLSKNNYISYNQIIYVIKYMLEMLILFMLVFDKDNRGLHDYISNTKVIEAKRE